MPFAPPDRWHREVPGTRWFQADLHLHTLDDPNVAVPEGISGPRDDPAVLSAYAGKFLDAAVEQGVGVLGITPHAAGISTGVSSVWTILETWREGVQRSSERPYRDLIYAVYPGFEPNFADGNRGIHLIFLFEPDIDRDRYFRAFHAVMEGRQPYDDHNNLVWTPKSLTDAFRALDDAQVIGSGRYLVIAPHPLQPNGLLSRPGHYITDLAEGRIQAAELGRDRTLDEELAANSKLRHAYKSGRVALYHASDSIRLPRPGNPPAERELGHRFVLLKLASPTLEGLRQAFLGRASRLRIPYHRPPQGQLSLAADLPDPLPHGVDSRPWIREIRVEGGTSFHRGQTFHLSPDLTCIIGGSMTGKSTLLDGLRLHLGGGQSMPDPGTDVGRHALARARQRFLSGNPTIEVESPAGDVALPVAERFAMRFFSQGELESLAGDDDGIEHLLFHLVPGRSQRLLRQRDEIRELDSELAALTRRLGQIQEQLADAEQQFQRTAEARAAMERFAQAGTAALPPAQQDAARCRTFREDVEHRIGSARGVAEDLACLVLPTLNNAEIGSGLTPPASKTAATLLENARNGAASVVESLEALQDLARGVEGAATARLEEFTRQVQEALIASGGSAEDLNRFDAYARNAQHYDSVKAAMEEKQAERDRVWKNFGSKLGQRDTRVAAHREDLRTLCTDVQTRFSGRLEVEIDEEGRYESLRQWMLALRSNGITRWWNSGGAGSATPLSLRPIAKAAAENRPADALEESRRLGMSDAVAQTFLEQIAPWQRQLELYALRSPDRYRIRWIEDGQAKELDDLSGGRRVAVLLSLVLESDDPTPLFVDQPEDQLDNRFLNETIIPALNRLKGRRQVVFATHNANLVVNGDADQVIVLEADAEHGRVAADGAIEDLAIREAIIRTLDGGGDAFRLRRAKYGF